MTAWVLMRPGSGEAVDLGPGAIIGRSPRCALFLDDGRVSEAHAMVSLRGGALRLIALRGRFAVEGRTLADVELAPGMEICFAPGLEVVVEDVLLPEFVLALAAEGEPRVVLQGTTSLLSGGELAPGWRDDALAWVWSAGQGWRLRLGDAAAGDLCGGAVFEVGGTRWEAAEVPLALASAEATRLDGALRAPIRVIARFQTVHIQMEGADTVLLEGVPGRIVSELVAFGGPVAWDVLARQIWRDAVDPSVLRPRWDAALQRLRARLRAGGVRPDLVRSDRTGHAELLLEAHDELVDET